MCGRYWIEADQNEEMMEIIKRMQRLDAPMKTAGEIFPGDGVPVLCKSRAGNIRPFAMEWGWRMDGGRRIINARSETIFEKPLFRDGIRNRRCLLPMSAYFEWETRLEGKIKYRIAPEGSGIFYLAGLYRFEGGKPLCTVITTAAQPDIAFIHHRMPVILNGAERESWLGGGEIDFAKQVKLDFAQA